MYNSFPYKEISGEYMFITMRTLKKYLPRSVVLAMFSNSCSKHFQT